MRVIFVEHPFHQKTGSSEFFLDILKTRVTEINRISREDFTLQSALAHEFIILWQADDCIPIALSSGRKTVVIPMLDEALTKSSGFYRTASSMNFISFSKVLNQFLQLSGCSTEYVQYWPKPQPKRNRKLSQDSLRVFFWERTPSHVRVHDVITWFAKYDFSLRVRQHWDPNHKISHHQSLKYNKKI